MDGETKEKMKFPGKVEARQMLFKPISLDDYMKFSARTILQQNAGPLSDEQSIYFLEEMNFKGLGIENITVLVC